MPQAPGSQRAFPPVPLEPCPDLVPELEYPRGHAVSNGETLRVRADGSGLAIGLRCSSGEVALQWTIDGRRVVRNSWIGDAWGVGEEDAWAIDRSFELDLKRTPSRWEVMINGERRADLDYVHRTAASVTSIETTGTARVFLLNRKLSLSKWHPVDRQAEATFDEALGGTRSPGCTVDEVVVSCGAQERSAASPPAPPPSAPPASPAVPTEGEVDEEEIDATQQNIKCILCAMLVIGCLAGFISYVLLGRRDWESANPNACPELPPGRPAPRSCDECGEGTLWFPLGGEFERSWAKNTPVVGVVLNLFGLLWCFLGVAIVCDQFMASVETITSREKVVWIKVHGGARHKFRIHTWNPTVANLTLMALGSSAPEILLALIELANNSFFSGQLGPSTIVGSAAYNLLVITAICIASIPDNETRKIDAINVFAVTASMSILAYAWLVVILQVNTPDLVDIPEGCITFIMFPLLVVVAWCADKGMFGAKQAESYKNGEACEERVEAERKRLEASYGKHLDLDTVRMVLEHNARGKQLRGKSRAEHRLGMMRSITGGLKPLNIAPGNSIGFAEKSHFILECAGSISLNVVSTKPPGCPVRLRYFTVEGQAKPGVRYKHTEGFVDFGPNETQKTIEIPIIDNDTWDAEEEFFVQLADLRVLSEGRVPDVVLGMHRTSVTVINDDEPGTLSFAVEEVMTCDNVETVTVGVERTNGTCGRIVCKFETQDDSALQGLDYSYTSGMLELQDGETHFRIDVPIMKHGVHPEDRRFRIVLSDGSEGVRFFPKRVGGEQGCVCEVVLAGSHRESRLHKCMRGCFNARKTRKGLRQWRDQFPAALYVCGSIEDQAQASAADWFFHCLALFWKLLFALVPPASLVGGWLCFFTALVMIGLVTAVVGDLATLLGCYLSIPPDITAITIVALGTSLPDTFASKSSAQHDPAADNSIGNVTGSNSVNVFLGLGMPWTLGAFYWNYHGRTSEWKNRFHNGKRYEEYWWNDTYQNGGFIVPAGSLFFSVTVFCTTALVCVGLLMFRRKKYGGELGGPIAAQRRDATLLCVLWATYIGVSAWWSLSNAD